MPLIPKVEPPYYEINETLPTPGGLPYLLYTALLTQTGTNAPVITLLYNNLGATITAQYISVGTYTLTASIDNTFPIAKTAIILNTPNLGGGRAWHSADITNKIINIGTLGSGGGGLQNDKLLNTTITIEVYP